MSNYLSKLNDSQREAVTDIYGPSFCVAGAGSGKTRVIISRMMYMLDNNIDPNNILLFTFTNKAANEMKERAASEIGERARQITAGTYHSICFKILRLFAYKLNFESNITIVDSEDSFALLKKITSLKDDKMITKVASYISECKSKLISPQQAILNAENSYEKTNASYYNSYQSFLRKQNCMDFNDLLYYTGKLLDNDAEVISYVRQKYKYIMSDESQDCGWLDNHIIQSIAGDNMNVCYAFDDYQSIYGFRGASMDIVLNLEKYYPGIREHKLEQNYRSTKNIVNAAKDVMSNNMMQLNKDIFSDNDDGLPVCYFESNNTKEEAATIASFVQTMHLKHNIPYNEMSVLYRMSFQSEAIESALLKKNIPYEIKSGLNFYARKEIKDIVSYIKFYYNNNDMTSFERCINTPKRGIGQASIDKIVKVSDANNCTLLEACIKTIDTNNGKIKKSLQNFVSCLDIFKQDIDPKSMLVELLDKIKYYDYLQETERLTYDDKVENINELYNIMSDYDTLDDFINESMLLNKSEDEDEKEDKVQLMTVHGSKGLEWKLVFVCGLNEGTMPHWRASDAKSLEEERRIMYVAMTRAKEYLFLSRSKVVKKFGVDQPSTKSRFIGEINKNRIKDLSIRGK